MPEIKITEKDLTTGYVDEQDYVVFVPGNVGRYASGSDAKARKQYEYLGKTTLFNDLDEFINAIGSTPTEYKGENKPFTNGLVTYDPGFLYAKFLLSKGAKVYYAVPNGDSPRTETISQTPTFEQRTLTYDFAGENSRTVFENPQTSEPIALDGEGVYYERTQTTTVSYNTDAVFKDANGTHSMNYDDAGSKNLDDFWETGNFTESSVTYTNIVTTVITTVTIKGKTTQINAYADMVAKINNSAFYIDLDDRSLYQFRFLTTGGYVAVSKTANETLPQAIQSIQTIALTRGDCIALIDHAWDLTDNKDITASATKCSVGEKGKRSTMFSPWCKYTIDTIKDLPMPASMAYLEAFTSGVANNPTWYAMAGRLRGGISGTPIVTYGEKFAEKLNNPNGNDTGVSVNAIAYTYPYGLLIWGNRTLHTNNGLVASSFLNIRQLSIDIFKSLYINAKGYMFEQNSDRLWFNFKANIETLLNNMLTGEGIEGYKVIREDAGKATIKATIRIVPMYAVEKFDLTVELADSITINEE